MRSGLIILLGLSIVANIAFSGFILSSAKPAVKSTPSEANAYPYLSKRLFAESQNDFIINFTNLRNKLTSYAAEHRLHNDKTRFSLYFEYLPSGISIGVNEKDPYIAASLLKVPIIMGVYKYIETGKLSENTELTLKESDLDPQYGNLWKRGVGAKLSVREAIQLTLAESDNTAKSVLFNNVPLETLTDVFEYLDIPNEVIGNAPVVTTKNYSSILRSLYLSTYLSMENSHKLLEKLTESNFSDKIAAGIPKSIPVAHKIGVHDTQNPEGSIYTDCGIVYIPKRPYILCIMMRNSENDVQTHMKAISGMIYDFVSSKDFTASK